MHMPKIYSLLVATSFQKVASQIPTESPSPTESPISMPWEIEYLGLAADFSADSDDELVLTYSVGKRPHETQLLANDCTSPITGIAITKDDSRAPDDDTHELLSLAYGFDKSAIATSNIWNGVDKKIELCQVVRLIIPAAGAAPKMVIAEDIRELEIEFDLSVDYQIENDLGGATIDSESGSTNVTSYVSSCKCGGGQNFTCDSGPLFPNDVLHVCIKSTSSDVEIDFLDSMDITQGTASLPVVAGDSVSVPSITQRVYVPAENGVVVSTRVPTNLFEYDEGNSITISGEIDMKLVGDSRRLQSTTESANGDGDDAVSAYGFEVALAQQEHGGHGDDDHDHSSNSGTAIATMSAATFGIMLVLV